MSKMSLSVGWDVKVSKLAAILIATIATLVSGSVSLPDRSQH
jgi:hypothetical protein